MIGRRSRQFHRNMALHWIIVCAVLACMTAHAQTTAVDAASSSRVLEQTEDAPESSTEEQASHQYGDLLGDPRVFAYEFVPPLGVDDSIYLLRSAMLLLKPETRNYVPLDRPKIMQMLKINIDYLQLMDNRYSTLRHYTWIAIGEQGVAKGGKDRDEFRPSTPIENVSAIAVRVEHEDVRLERLEVWDVNRNGIELPVTGRIFPHGKPARDVIFLNRQVTLERVKVTAASTDSSREAELVIEAGITSEPEHAKYAIDEINTARKDVQEGADGEAIECLKRAWRHLNRFKEQVGL
ncbi:hypothetical protein JXA32_06075 [Candidatus Sumerlaeota bacterium]|nr:hypothetical protein [Candidatus Sumerlaeota bacterium]